MQYYMNLHINRKQICMLCTYLIIPQRGHSSCYSSQFVIFCYWRLEFYILKVAGQHWETLTPQWWDFPLVNFWDGFFYFLLFLTETFPKSVTFLLAVNMKTHYGHLTLAILLQYTGRPELCIPVSVLCMEEQKEQQTVLPQSMQHPDRVGNLRSSSLKPCPLSGKESVQRPERCSAHASESDLVCTGVAYSRDRLSSSLDSYIPAGTALVNALRSWQHIS